MKLYSINRWDELFENNRSRGLSSLKWVVIPNKHDGETYSSLITHTNGAQMFAAWVLLVQVASKCPKRGVLMRQDGSPLTASALSIKTRAPIEWFQTTLEWLEQNSDWIKVEVVNDVPVRDVEGAPQEGAGIPQEADVPTAPRDEERKGIERKGIEENAPQVMEWVECIYSAYPRKVGRPDALKAIKRALGKVPFKQLLAKTEQYAAIRGGDTNFVPNPSTWFNQERYNDDPSTWEPRKSTTNGSSAPKFRL